MFRWAHSVVLLAALLDNARGLEFIKYVEHLDADGAVILVLPARSGRHRAEAGRRSLPLW